jgi:FkbM family methyltransferase
MREGFTQEAGALKMADVTRQVRIGGREWQVQGSDQDRYLSKLQEYADGLTTLIDAARGRVVKDATILDVGANLGLATLALSELVPDGRVVAFEAGPETARHLAATIAANGVTNCTVVPSAVGSGSGVVRFETMPSLAAVAHVLQASHATSKEATIEVPVVSLDDWLANAGIDNVAFIKLDTEGYEPWVLDGAREVITRDRPAIFMEFNSWCLLAFADVNPVVFAQGLWGAFRVSTPGASGEPELPSAYTFAHQNMVRRRCVEDVLLELRDGRRAPSLEELVGARQPGRTVAADRDAAVTPAVGVGQ